MISHVFVFFFKRKTAYEMRMSDGSSDVCSSDLRPSDRREREPGPTVRPGARRLHRPRLALAPARLSGVTVKLGRLLRPSDRTRMRSAKRSVGKACFSKFSSRLSAVHLQNITTILTIVLVISPYQHLIIHL